MRTTWAPVRKLPFIPLTGSSKGNDKQAAPLFFVFLFFFGPSPCPPGSISTSQRPGWDHPQDDCAQIANHGSGILNFAQRKPVPVQTRAVLKLDLTTDTPSWSNPKIYQVRSSTARHWPRASRGPTILRSIQQSMYEPLRSSFALTTKRPKGSFSHCRRAVHTTPPPAPAGRWQPGDLLLHVVPAARDAVAPVSVWLFRFLCSFPSLCLSMYPDCPQGST